MNKENIIKEMEAYRLPDYMQSCVINYLVKGYQPGIFLYNILTNNLIGAVTHADFQNRECLASWVLFIYNQFPGIAWGSKQKVEEWMLKRREDVRISAT